MMTKIFNKIICFGILAWFGLSIVNASVVMTNSRVIYPAGAAEVNVQLTNNDEVPYAIQVWFDDGDVASTPQTAGKVPFISTPSVFRIQPKSGQTVRVVFTGADLPQDRESVYYLNFLQIPAITKESSDNKLVVLLKNRIKVFYRPATLKGGIERHVDNLTFKVEKQGKDIVLIVSNPTAYYANFTDASLNVSGKKHSVAIGMVSPKSEEKIVLSNVPASILNTKPQLHYSLINDQGGKYTQQYSIY